MANAYGEPPLPQSTKPNVYLFLTIALIGLIIGSVLRLKYSSGDAAMIITASGNEIGSILYIVLSLICFGVYFFLIMIFSTKWSTFCNKSLANSLALHLFPVALVVAACWFAFLLSYDGSANKYSWASIWNQLLLVYRGKLHEAVFIVTLVLFFSLSSALVFNLSVCFAMVGKKCAEQADMYSSAQNFIFLSSALALVFAIFYAILLFNTQIPSTAPASNREASAPAQPTPAFVAASVHDQPQTGSPAPPESNPLKCKTFLKQYFQFGIVYGVFAVCVPLLVLFVMNAGSLTSFASGLGVASKFTGFIVSSAVTSEASGIVLLSIPNGCRNEVLTLLPYIASGLRGLADVIHKAS